VQFQGLTTRTLDKRAFVRVCRRADGPRFERGASRRIKGKDNPDSAIREEIVGVGMTGHDEDTMRTPDRRPAVLRAARRLTAKSSAATGGASSAGSAVFPHGSLFFPKLRRCQWRAKSASPPAAEGH